MGHKPDVDPLLFFSDIEQEQISQLLSALWNQRIRSNGDLNSLPSLAELQLAAGSIVDADRIIQLTHNYLNLCQKLARAGVDGEDTPFEATFRFGSEGAIVK